MQVHRIICFLYVVFKRIYSNNFNNNFMFFGRRELTRFMYDFGFGMYVCQSDVNSLVSMKAWNRLRKAGITCCFQAARLRISAAFECFKIPFEMGI